MASGLLDDAVASGDSQLRVVSIDSEALHRGRVRVHGPGSQSLPQPEVVRDEVHFGSALHLA